MKICFVRSFNKVNVLITKIILCCIVWWEKLNIFVFGQQQLRRNTIISASQCFDVCHCYHSGKKVQPICKKEELLTYDHVQFWECSYLYFLQEWYIKGKKTWVGSWVISKTKKKRFCIVWFQKISMIGNSEGERDLKSQGFERKVWSKIGISRGVESVKTKKPLPLPF